MSHRVHPKAFRLREIGDWLSRGFYKDAPKYLAEDFRIRKFLQKKIGSLAVEKIEIERFPGKVKLIISSARPGLIIGRGGEGIERLKEELEKKVLGRKPLSKKAKDSSSEKEELKIEIKEIRDPWSSASLTAQYIAKQIEKRFLFRRVLKQGMEKVMASGKIKGCRIQISGRLNGVEISRTEWLLRGNLPRQTLRADIDYARASAYCTYGVIGIKVWMYKGEKF